MEPLLGVRVFLRRVAGLSFRVPIQWPWMDDGRRHSDFTVRE